MCRVRQWNLSYGSLTSYEAREKLRTLKAEEPLFWNELTANTTHHLPGLKEHLEEDKEKIDDEDDKGDDSSLEMSAVLSTLVTGEVAGNVSVGSSGGLVSQNEADDVEAEPVEVVGCADGDSDKTSAVPTTVESQQTKSGLSGEQADSEKRRGKRQRFGNKWYDVKDFMRH
jgi:hypothetical protein